MTLELPKLGPPELQVSAAPPEQRKSRTCETSPGPPALWGPVACRHRRGGRHLAAPEHADGARTSTRLHPQPRGDEQVQPELLAHARAAREVQPRRPRCGSTDLVGPRSRTSAAAEANQRNGLNRPGALAPCLPGCLLSAGKVAICRAVRVQPGE